MTPEEMQLMIVQLQEDAATKDQAIADLTQTVADQNKKIDDLMETNQALFKKVVTDQPDNDDQDEEPSIEDFASGLLGKIDIF